MRRITIAAIGAAVIILLAGCSSYSAEDCKNAIDSSSTKTSRPEQCEGLSHDDYDALLTAWALKQGLNDMPEGDRDLLDYYDDGSVNGSIVPD